MDSLENRGRNNSPLNMMIERPREIFRKLFVISVPCGYLFLFYLPVFICQLRDIGLALEYFTFVNLSFLILLEVEPLSSMLPITGTSMEPTISYCEPGLKACLNVFLLCTSILVIVLNKDAQYECWTNEENNGSQFDLYSAAAFSLYALGISLEKDQSMELGFFDFLLQLTMDDSLETSALYQLSAAMYFVVLIFARIHLALAKTRPNSNGSEQNVIARSYTSNISSTEARQELKNEPYNLRQNGLGPTRASSSFTR